MSNFRLRDPDAVLIHIPKTGGTSIRKGLWQGRYDRPRFGMIPKPWMGLFKFAFVRHPFDRLISAYKMFTDGAKGDPQWSLPRDARPLTLDEFMDIVTDESIIYDERRSTFEERVRHHAIPQTHPFNCLAMADFVGRFENLQADFAVVAGRVGVTGELPKMHVTSHGPWWDYLSGELLQRCAAYYRQDLEELGYSAEPGSQAGA